VSGTRKLSKFLKCSGSIDLSTLWIWSPKVGTSRRRLEGKPRDWEKVSNQFCATFKFIGGPCAERYVVEDQEFYIQSTT
jgi:hypothetical protein